MITDVRTVLQDLPVAIKGFVVTDENGDPTICAQRTAQQRNKFRDLSTRACPYFRERPLLDCSLDRGQARKTLLL